MLYTVLHRTVLYIAKKEHDLAIAKARPRPVTCSNVERRFRQRLPNEPKTIQMTSG